MKSSLAISVAIHVALVAAVLALGTAVIRDRDVFYVELKSVTVAPPSRGGATSASVSKSKVTTVKKTASKPVPKKIETEKPAREVLTPEPEVKEPRVSEPSVAPAAEQTAEPTASQASYVVESSAEGSSIESDTTGDDSSRGDSTAGQGGVGDSEVSGGVVSRDALLLQIREAIQRELTYPPLARRRRLEGTVVAGFLIDGGGEPHDIKIVESSGYSILDKEVIAIIRRASPYPHIDERVEVPVSFKLVTGR